MKKQPTKKEREALRRKAEFQDSLYRILRDHQDGKVNGNSTAVGQLTQELTAVYDQINAAAEKLNAE